jgi:NAD(P)-dependent dehydrogenase (short-subunit alcohol dehydrogenase family)
MALDGRVAVVTGGSRGIGQGITLRLGRAGARVAIVDRDPADETLRLLRAAGSEPWSTQADVSDPASVAAAFGRLEQEVGRPYALVNAAGVFADEPFLATSAETWDRVMGVNAKGVFLCGQQAAHLMRDQAGGRIVNILSTASVQGFALESAYCASKGAVLLLTKVMAIELAQYGITVNGVGPGTVPTAMGDAYLAHGPIADHELARTPLGRFGTPADIAEAVLFLVDRASWLTGQALYVDGGFLAAGLPVLTGLGADSEAVS